MRLRFWKRGAFAEIYSERMWETQKAGEIFKARVDSVLPGMNASFREPGGWSECLPLPGGCPWDRHTGKRRGRRTGRKGSPKGKGGQGLGPGFTARPFPGFGPGRKRNGRFQADPRRRGEKAPQADCPCPSPDWVRDHRQDRSRGSSRGSSPRDLAMLLELWQEISSLAESPAGSFLLYRDLGLVGRILRDDSTGMFPRSFVRLSRRIRKSCSLCPRFLFRADNRRSSFTRDPFPIFDFTALEKELAAALERKVWLPSGGTLGGRPGGGPDRHRREHRKVRRGDEPPGNSP